MSVNSWKIPALCLWNKRRQRRRFGHFLTKSTKSRRATFRLITATDLYIWVTVQRIIGPHINYDVIYCSHLMLSGVTTECKPRDSFHLELVGKSHGFRKEDVHFTAQQLIGFYCKSDASNLI
ncbi:unnamed protein product [Clavelina lepadiformis]|uniref:Uncharacterized protein n=1 Tax=Clavelina lepadiformis TaxID=159417 RepID=A0ABP0GBF5_CLALP